MVKYRKVFHLLTFAVLIFCTVVSPIKTATIINALPDACGITVHTSGGGAVNLQHTAGTDPALNIQIGAGNSSVTLENSRIKVRYGPAFYDHDEFIILDFVSKSNGIDQVDNLPDGTAPYRYFDADAGRGALTDAAIIYDGTDRKTIRLTWASTVSPGNSIVEEVSIYPNQDFLQIDYVNVQYGLNLIDQGMPGGIDNNGTHIFYNHDAWMTQETHNRENDPPGYNGYITHFERADLIGSYYNRYAGDGVNDPINPALAYNGQFIGAVYNGSNGVGFGRVMPVTAISIIKLLNVINQRNGFEIYPYPFLISHPSFTGYIYAFTGGPTAAITAGQELADGVPFLPYQCGDEVELGATSYTNWDFTDWTGGLSGSTNPITLTLTSSHVVTATFANTAQLFTNFDSDTLNSDPINWLDTEANSSLIENDALFKVVSVDGEHTLGTASTASDIHAHYVRLGSDTFTDYTYTGRMQLSDSNGSLGVTVLSQYPTQNAYYRLGRNGGTGSFSIVPVGTAVTGVTNTGIVPTVGTWYRFVVQVNDTGSQTEINAKVWPDSDPEPAAWQATAVDNTANRLTMGTFGVWSSGAGSKYWDELALDTPTDITPPTIDLWYGRNQTFGQWGSPQQWVNILGNVSDNANSITSLTYSLNGVPGTPDLSIGPDHRRLADPGDFNVELDIATLTTTITNTVVITAVDSVGNISTETVALTYITNTWPLPYTADWDALTDAQIVDGQWALTGGGIRTQQIDYDRVLAIGDTNWTDYEVTVPITIHGIDPSSYGDPYSIGPGIGVNLRWLGHQYNDTFCPYPAQPRCYWEPSGSSNWYEWLQSSPDVLHIFAEPPGGDTTNTTAIQFSTGNTYWFKARGENTAVGPLYHFKVWLDGTPEPSAWTLQRQADVGNLAYGSFLLVAHHVDATFGPVTAVPLYDLTLHTVGNGTLNSDPVQTIKYSYGDVITLTATADPGASFTGWSGDLSGSTTPTTFTITKDTVITGTFTAITTPTLTVNVTGNGQVTRNPVGVTVAPNTFAYNLGATVDVTATANSGWLFTGWSGDLSGSSNPESLLMNTNHVITATFVEVITPTLTVNVVGNGSVSRSPLGTTLSPGVYEYPFAQVVTTTAVPDSNWVFSGWSGDLTGTTNPAQLTLTGNRTITATFTAVSPALVSADFNACTLDTGTWSFINPLGDAALTLNGTQAVFSIPAGPDHDVWGTSAADFANQTVRLRQSVADTDFEVVVKFESGVSQEIQMQGILIEQDNDDLLRFEFIRQNLNQTNIFGATIVGGAADKIINWGQFITSANASPLYLRVTRFGDNWTVAYSLNGTNWTDYITNYTRAMTVTAVDIHVGNASPDGIAPAPAFTAAVDYLFNTAAPIAPEDSDTHVPVLHTMGNGAVSITPNQPSYACGDAVTLTAAPSADWDFANWNGAIYGSTVNAAHTISSSNTITATFSYDYGSGPSSVGSSSSLDLWLAGDRGVYTNAACTTAVSSPGDLVACWADQSGNGHNALAASGTSPTYQIPGSLGQPTVAFNGSTQRLATDAFPLFNNEGAGLTVFTVFASNNNTGQKDLLNFGAASNSTYELGYGTNVGSFELGRGNGNAVIAPDNTVANNTFSMMTTFVSPDNVTPGNIAFYQNGTVLSKNNANAGWLNPGTYPTTSHSLDIGARNSAGLGSYDAYHDGDIAEVIVFDHALNDARRTLVENYLSAKYGIAISNDVYNSPTYTLSVAGIGQEANGKHRYGASDGLILAEDGGTLDNGDYVMMGHRTVTNGNNLVDVPGGVAQRWERVWYIDKTGTVDVSLTFDFSDGGMNNNGSLPGDAANYVLLYSPTNSFNWQIKLTGAITVTGDQITFTVPDGLLADGYYTLGTTDATTSPTALTLQSLTVHPQTAVSTIFFSILTLFSLVVVFVGRKAVDHKP